MPRSRIIAIWFTVLWSVCLVTFITFMSLSSPLNLFAVFVTGVMWVACIGLTYCVVKLHREYWK